MILVFYKQICSIFPRIGTDDNETIDNQQIPLSRTFSSPKRRIDNETDAVT